MDLRRWAIRGGSLFVRKDASSHSVLARFVMIVLFRWASKSRPAPYEETGPPIEVSQVGQLQTCKKAYEIWNLANFANFVSMFRWDFEDLSPPYEETGPPIEVGQVGQLQTCKKAYEIWNFANFGNFFSMFRWDFEDLSPPYEETGPPDQSWPS